MKILSFVISGMILAFFASCSKENELKKSVFIYDKDFTELPAYSEWGYNTFGANYDREVFVSNDIRVPAKIMVADSSMSLILDGQKGYYYDQSDMSVTFRFSGLTPEQYSDLTQLNDSTIDLKSPACQVILSMDNTSDTIEILNGKIMFKRVQDLQVDKRHIEAILSGYFEFRAVIQDKPVTVSDGRFDIGIGTDNFYHD